MAPWSLENTRWSTPMPQSNDLSRSLTALDQDSTLIAIIEMSQASWLVGAIVPGIERHPLKKLAPDAEEAAAALERRGGQGGPRGKAHRSGLRGRPGRLLAGSLVLGAQRRSSCHPCLERCGLARASARQNRPPGR